MHRELKGLPKRVVLDTNLLFDAAFVREGLAQKAVLLLRELGFSPVIDGRIEEEAKQLLQKKRQKLRLAFDPQKELDAFIGRIPLLVLPHAPVIPITGINPSDQHVAQAASHYDAWVLTGDAPLILECEKAKINARFPWDVISEARRKDEPNLTLEDIFRVVPLDRDRGFIFARLTPMAWSKKHVSKKESAEYQVCNIENFGRMFYDARKEEWVFELAIGVAARAKCSIGDGETWAVCGSYSLPGGGKEGHVVVRAGKDSSTKCKATVRTLKRITNMKPGKATGVGGGPGPVYTRGFVMGPQGMGEDRWRAILAIPDSAPNPYDTGALDGVLRAKQAQYDAHRTISVSDEDVRRWLLSGPA